MRARYTVCAILVTSLLVTAGCKMTGGHNLPPAERLMAPGPGVDGPGPGVLAPPIPPMMSMVEMPPVQVAFVGPEGMQVRWDITGQGQFDSVPLITPGRQNFAQGRMFQLKLTNVPGREGVELYPTVEIGAATPRTAAFLAHNAIPIQLTEEDFDQVLTGNFVRKVIYVPDPEFQQLALAGVETLVSTRLDPGVDPVVEADHRGSILAILRIGNKDLEMPGFDAGQQIMPAAFQMGPAQGIGSGPIPISGAGSGQVLPPSPNYVAGITSPLHGMPITGTPIGLPGPPHLPLGGPAGLRKHTMKNHTYTHLPGPVNHLRFDVQQQPGISYPMPANSVKIIDQNIAPSPHLHQPHGIQFQMVR